MTRTVRDTAAALDAVAGPMSGDPFEIVPPSGSYLAQLGAPVRPLRIGYWWQPWSGHLGDPEIVAATESVAALLADLGHNVEAARPDFSWEAFLAAMTDVWAATNAHTIDGMAAALGRAVASDTVEGATLDLVRHGRSLSAHALLDAEVTANHITRQVGAFFDRYDLLLTPTLGALPAALGTYDPWASTPPIEMFAEWSRHESFLPVFNATGHPAISLPLAISAAAQPIGMQLVGRFGREDLLLRVAAVLEQAKPWVGRIPAIHASRLVHA